MTYPSSGREASASLPSESWRFSLCEKYMLAVVSKMKINRLQHTAKVEIHDLLLCHPEYQEKAAEWRERDPWIERG